jgi:MFS family permease
MKSAPAKIQPEQIKNSYYAGIFFISLSTLLLEFTLTRVLSVSLWYHFAFMIISVALLGFGVSGVVLALSKKLREIKPDILLTLLSMIYGISVIGSFILMNKIPFDPFSLLTEGIQFLYLPVYYLLITIPFFFSGLIISVLLTRFTGEVSRLYFFDLVGAGLSCLAFVLIMPEFGGNGTIVFVAAIGFFSAVLFAYENHKGLVVIAIILMGLSFSFLIDRDNRIPINVSLNKLYGNYMKQKPELKMHTEWNTFSKIDVMRDEDSSPDGYDVLLAIIDEGNATTNIPNVKTLPPPTKPADASNLAYVLKDSADKVFIIGSAGGGEILTGLYYNAKKIIGVEINGVLNDLIKDKLVFWTGPLVKNNKNVKIITDDARSVISSKRIAYDVIISAHTISSSAVSSGAMSLVENYILTKEAMKEYLTHLKSDGVLYISRPETQLPKLITTLKIVRQELTEGLEDSKNNFVVFRRPPTSFESDKSFMAGVVYKKNGFDEFDLIDVRNEASFLGLNIEYDPLSRQDGIYKQLIESENIDKEIENFESDIKPATDDKPFFDNNIGFGNLTWEGMKETFAQDDKAILALKDRPVAETTLLIILVQTIIVAGLLLLFPLKFMRLDAGSEFDKKYLIYFACLGIAYIMLQLSMIQKFTLFLGQPVITLLTVIATMLVASGIGSMFSFKFLNSSKKRLILIFIIIAILSVALGLFNPFIFKSFVRLELVWRIIISIVLIFPIGFFMGMPFPIGLSLIKDSEKKYVAFAWGINGFFSVIGTVISIILAMIIGFKFVFILSGCIYLLAMIFISTRYKKVITN